MADRLMRRAGMLLGLAGLVCALTLLLGTGRAEASIPIHLFEAGTTTSQAGAHPDVVVKTRVGSRDTLGDYGPYACSCKTIRDLIAQTPPGLIGAPTTIPKCKQAEFVFGNCPIDSQVGVIVINLFQASAGGQYIWIPMYNMETADEQLALFSGPIPLAEAPANIEVSVRTESDFGLEFHAVGVTHLVDINELTTIFWGVPASSEHDALRFEYGHTLSTKYHFCDAFENSTDPVPMLFKGEFTCGTAPPPVPANAPDFPFLSNPTSCVGRPELSVRVIAYDDESSLAQTTIPEMTSCDLLSFDPSLSANPTTTQADTPTGLDVDLRVPQFLGPTTPSPSQIKEVRTTLPVGLSINSSAADGKGACTEDEFNIGTRLEAQCPDVSKVGTLSIESAALPGLLPGAIYLGEPLPGDRYRIFIAADGFSLHIKLKGTARLDPQTGQIVVTFEDLPQAPFTSFSMHFFGAERGLMSTPPQCGTYPVETEFVPWATGLPNQTATQFFTIDSGPNGSPCPPPARPFNPTINAGVADSTGGAKTSFAFELNREDGDQTIAGVDVTTPPGFTGSLAGIPYCSEGALARAASLTYAGLLEMSSPSCPAASQVGVISATAGSGSRPVTLPGKVYLAGPYRGAPLSLAIVTPAVSGPYDLGSVVVRLAIRVDPRTARLTTVSDPVPQLIEGIPLRLRHVVVNLNRDGFVINPTNCSPSAVNAQITGDQGASVSRSVHFQVANCAALDFDPKLSLAWRGSTKRRGHPGVRSNVKFGPGEANLSRVSVTLPKGSLLDNGHLDTICTRVQFAVEKCPPGSSIGTVSVRTPLLDDPLQGSIFLRASSNRLPDMVLDLKGQIDIEAVARIDSVRARLRSTFEDLPDVPVESVDFALEGGSKGLLVNSVNLCRQKAPAMARFVGQNGKSKDMRIRLGAPCTKRSKRRAHSHRRSSK